MLCRRIVFLVYLGVLTFTLSTPAVAASNDNGESPGAFSTLWGVPDLYINKDSPWLQEFSLVGRYHGQYWWSESEGASSNDWENRRIYFGFNAKLFRQVTLEAQIKMNDDLNPVYKGLYDAYLQWENIQETLAVSIGRLDYLFTGMERSTSSKRITTLERALLVNQVMPGEVVGVYAAGNLEHLKIRAGLFSGSIEDEFTSFEGGFGVVFGLSAPVPLFYAEGTLHLDYLYNNGDEDNSAFKPYEHTVSLWHKGRKGALGMGIDLTAAAGVDEQSDVFALTLLPTYDFAENLLISGDALQAVMRYHYASSSDDDGLKFNKRYEQPVTSGRGDAYNSLYLGLNYFMYQQKLKLMAGVEYFTMDGVADENSSESGRGSVNGWSCITGVRVYF